MAAVFSGIFTASEQARQEAWLRQVAEALVELQANKPITLEQIFEDGRFHSAIIQGARIVAETNRDEMRTTLANAVSNSGSWSGNNEALDRFFMRVLGRYEPEHLLILKILNDPEEFHQSRGLTMGESSLAWILATIIYEGIEEWEPLGQSVLSDLRNDGFIISEVSVADDLRSTDGAYTTPVGRSLLRFANP